MKKNIFYAACIIFAMVSCSNEPTETKTEKEVIAVPAPAPAPEPKKVEEKTSVTIDKKGVEVESKKVDVKVQPNN